MKILYAIQGAGNGRLNRARDIIPILEKYGKLDLFISGGTPEIRLPHKVHYYSDGFSYQYTSKGDIDYWRTFRHNRLARIMADISACPVEKYDLVVNDYEPITAWACRLQKKPCFALGHQYALLAPASPRPEKISPLGEWVARNYAPVTDGVGFHFQAYDAFTFPPLIRQQVRRMTPENKGHYTVYLPGISDQQLAHVLAHFRSVTWEVFSRYATRPYEMGNIRFRPIDNMAFLHSLAACEGVLTTAGFETPAEAMFLGKKLFVIPVRGQYDQQCNATALIQMGVWSANRFDRALAGPLQQWIDSPMPSPAYFPNANEAAVERLMERVRAVKASESKTTAGHTSPAHLEGLPGDTGLNGANSRVLNISPSGYI
jgi:uncharacterized protein (TIGR00661 family)